MRLDAPSSHEFSAAPAAFGLELCGRDAGTTSAPEFTPVSASGETRQSFSLPMQVGEAHR